MSSPGFQDEHAVHRHIDVALWKKTARFGQPYTWHFVALAAFAVVVAAAEIALPLLVGRVIDEATRTDRTPDLSPHLLGFVAFAVTMVVSIWCFIALAGRIATYVSYDIRRAAFAHLQQLHLGYFTQRPVGWLMSRLTGDCNLLSRILGWSLLDLVWGTCMIVGMATAMLVLNWRLGLAALAVCPALAVACRWFQWRLLVASRKVRKANSHLTAGFNESIQGVRTTKSLVRETQNLREFGGLSDTMYADSMRNTVYSSAFWPVLGTICSAATGIVLWYGGLNVLRDQLTVGELVTFLGLVTGFMHPIQETARSIAMILGAQASAERIQQVLDTPPGVRDTEAALRRLDAHADSARAHDPQLAPDGGPARIQRLDVDRVTFAYADKQPVLDDVSLTVTPGQTVALVGQTGGGKSTLVSLICRFYEPNQGGVLLDGVDYRERSLDWYQSQLGIVPQAPQLFNTTVRENIRYGRLDATDAEVEEAARLVNAHGFIGALADGYDTHVGEGGNQLSTGQKQLIALARTMLADPQVFVLDEATSSVDTETERLIQTAVDRLLEGRIAFVVAHRLSTIRHADQILVLDGGRVVERGTHVDLLAARGRYFELYTHQFSE